MPRTNPKKQSTSKAFEITFRDVQIQGQPQSWKTVLKTFSCRDLLKHLKSKGLDLSCDDSRRDPDAVLCDEWDESELHGRILERSSTLIGRFRVRQVDADADQSSDPFDPSPTTHVYADGGYPVEVGCDDIPY